MAYPGAFCACLQALTGLSFGTFPRLFKHLRQAYRCLRADCLRDRSVDAIERLARTEDARTLGIAQRGATIESAVRHESEIVEFLRQDLTPQDSSASLAALFALANKLETPNHTAGNRTVTRR